MRRMDASPEDTGHDRSQTNSDVGQLNGVKHVPTRASKGTEGTRIKHSIEFILGSHCKELHDAEKNTAESAAMTGAADSTSPTSSNSALNGKEPNPKQTPSYTYIIAQAILSAQDKKMSLGGIYEFISQNFPEFLTKGQGWRNCVRHNLSLSDCFIKAGRSGNGRGNYWSIHPRYMKNFMTGDFRKRRMTGRHRSREMLLRASMPAYTYQLPLAYPYFGPPPSQMRPRPAQPFLIDNILSNSTAHDSWGFPRSGETPRIPFVALPHHPTFASPRSFTAFHTGLRY